MTQIVDISSIPVLPGPLTRPTVWGLTAEQLHDAYWRCSGVQVVRRGERGHLQRGADLFLLIEPDQLVLFDLAGLAERLAWRAALITRLHLLTPDDESYRERVDIDADGLVRRVERRYASGGAIKCRLLLTRQRRIARTWMNADNRRVGWRGIRRISAASGVDHLRSPGECFTVSHPGDEEAFLNRLVELWHDPDRAIEGLRELQPRVWSASGVAIDGETVAIGPVWLGRSELDGEARCLMGPTWVSDDEDAASDQARSIRLLEISEIGPRDAPVALRKPREGGFIYAAAKRLLDVVVSGLGLFLTSPLLVVIAIYILLNDGPPVLYGHLRQTRGGRSFSCWKFRTMRHDADVVKGELASQNVCDGPQFFIENDPRVTRHGRFLRRFHLDELPQLWNVLIGQMSLVGPRPSPDKENQMCPAWREVRLSVRPGITGMWQLRRTRKPGADFQEWIRFDVEYVRRASFWLDLKILSLTAWAVLLKVGRHAFDKTR